MKDAASIPGFWAYDLFGYLLPGAFVLVAFGKFNSIGHDLVAFRWNQGKPHDVALFLGAGYILGHILSALASWFLEKRAVRNVLGYPTAAMFPRPAAAPAGRVRRAWRRLSRIVFPGYFHPYSQQFRKAVDERFVSEFGFHAGDDHDRFWVIWEWVAIHCPVAYRRAAHFLDLYGFSRNCSFACLLVGSLPFLPGANCPVHCVPWAGAALIGCLFLFINYTKLMRRMDNEVYRAFVAGLPESAQAANCGTVTMPGHSDEADAA